MSNKGNRVSRSDDLDVNIYTNMTASNIAIDEKILTKVLEDLPYPNKEDLYEFDKKIEMGTGLDPHLGNGVYNMRTDSEIKALLQASRTTVKERTINGFKQVQKTPEEMEKIAAERREEKLKMLAESKAAEKEVTPEQLELIKLRREIKRLQKNSKSYKIVERKGSTVNADDFGPPSQYRSATPAVAVKRVPHHTEDTFDTFADLAKAIDILDKVYGNLLSPKPVLEETVKEEVILSKWGRIKLEARNWLRRQAGKLIVLLQKI